jgi:hypothetical protein
MDYDIETIDSLSTKGGDSLQIQRERLRVNMSNRNEMLKYDLN